MGDTVLHGRLNSFGSLNPNHSSLRCDAAVFVCFISLDCKSSLRDQADFLAPMLPLSANVVYPTLAVVDCRAENMSTGRLFRTLRLVQLNAILCSDLSERECAYNEGTIDETDPEKVPLPSTLRCACVVVIYSSCSGSASAAV
jgi:hypothetical protein